MAAFASIVFIVFIVPVDACMLPFMSTRPILVLKYCPRAVGIGGAK